MTELTSRAMAIVDAAKAFDPAMDLVEVMYDVLDGALLTSIHRLIRDSFSGDDDFDDLRMEIDDVLGVQYCMTCMEPAEADADGYSTCCNDRVTDRAEIDDIIAEADSLDG